MTLCPNVNVNVLQQTTEMVQACDGAQLQILALFAMIFGRHKEKQACVKVCIALHGTSITGLDVMRTLMFTKTRTYVGVPTNTKTPHKCETTSIRLVADMLQSLIFKALRFLVQEKAKKKFCG